jgi:Ca2+-binding RTX toxin-like protein
MQGGDGNDTYYVDNIGDIVDETASSAASAAASAACSCPFCAGNVTLNSETSNAGTDKVVSTISFSLLDLSHVLGVVENLTLSGTAAINGTGNALDNVITGNSGSNVLNGGDGIDTLSFAGLTTAARVNLGITTAQATGYGNDTILNFENVIGSNGADIITGSATANVLSGGNGNDTISGAAGNDRISGGAGADTLTGGDDADVFVFTALADSAGKSRDTITDFADGIDKIDLSAIDAVTGGSDNGFTFIGASAFSGVAGQLQATVSATQTVISADVNGDRKVDFSIVLTGMHNLQDSDFIL